MAGLEVCKRTKEHNTTAPHLNMEDVLIILEIMNWHVVADAGVVGLGTGFIFGGVYEVSDISVHRWFCDPDHVILFLLPFLGHLVPVTGSHTQVDQGWVDKFCLEISPQWILKIGLRERSKGPVAHQELAGQVFHGDFMKDLTKQWPGEQRNIPNGASAERRARDFDTVSQVACSKTLCA